MSIPFHSVDHEIGIFDRGLDQEKKTWSQFISETGLSHVFGRRFFVVLVWLIGYYSLGTKRTKIGGHYHDSPAVWLLFSGYSIQGSTC